jgi:hypothetical protein
MIEIKPGQRWIWNKSYVLEVVEVKLPVFKVTCKVVQNLYSYNKVIGETEDWGTMPIEGSLGRCDYNWEYLIGQDNQSND